MRVLITGGAGFVGSRLALAFHAEPGFQVLTFDNLRRRGSELNLASFKDSRIEFVHGDIRHEADLDALDGNFDLMIEASAEPSVHAGQSGSPRYVLDTNLGGTVNCLEFARRRAGAFLFLSSSRVYSISALRNIRLHETDSRLEISPDQNLIGVSAAGISEHFSTGTARSFYGTSKLASEHLIQEYVASYGVKALINRCGVIAGPGQFGKVDQGFVSLWVAAHHFGTSLRYTGFGGTGKQVRDVLHATDLADLIRRQLNSIDQWEGEAYNVGGGPEISVSLRELTGMCREATGHDVPVGSLDHTERVDIPLYVSDYRKALTRFGWRPHRSVQWIVGDISEWIRLNESQLRSFFTSPPF
jgi:CDP-paratose 2-epimerase